MDATKLRSLLESIRSGAASVDSAIEVLRRLPYEDLDFAKIDLHRSIRCGFPEVIFCPGKTADQVVQIARRIVEAGAPLMATRISPEQMEAVRAALPDIEYHQAARMVTRGLPQKPPTGGTILIVSAGTSDIPVAEEARVTAYCMGNKVEHIYDAGVAGIHRLLHRTDEIQRANVIIVVAGMEGALASVVGGLVHRPVIAVPTSIGYGASFGGLAPLLTMLNSCAAGVSVVNIDNGFGAGYIASLINQTPTQEP